LIGSKDRDARRSRVQHTALQRSTRCHSSTWYAKTEDRVNPVNQRSQRQATWEVGASKALDPWTRLAINGCLDSGGRPFRVLHLHVTLRRRRYSIRAQARDNSFVVRYFPLSNKSIHSDISCVLGGWTAPILTRPPNPGLSRFHPRLKRRCTSVIDVTDPLPRFDLGFIRTAKRW
jgi:hypothetical protein